MHFAFMGLYMALCMVELRPTHLGTDISSSRSFLPPLLAQSGGEGFST